MTKHLTKATQGRKELYQPALRGAGPPWLGRYGGQEHEDAGHIASAVMEQRDKQSVPLAFPSYSVQGHIPGTVPLTLTVGLPSSIQLLWKLPDWHTLSSLRYF